MRRRLPPLRALLAFEVAARHLSFAKAAEELGVTPAAVSQQIKLLEDRLGTPLFHRGAKLTLASHTGQAAAALTEAFDALAGAAERLSLELHAKPLVISAPPTFAARWLVPRLERFHALHPEIELYLSATTRLVDLEHEGVDMAIRYGRGNYPGLLTERLMLEEEVVAVATPQLAGRFRTPAELCETTLLDNAVQGRDSGFPDWPTWLGDMGVVPATPLKLRRFGDTALVIEAALAGLGVALSWRTLLEDELGSGRLVALFPGQRLAGGYHLVRQPKRNERPGAQAFRSWLLNEAMAARV